MLAPHVRRSPAAGEARARWTRYSAVSSPVRPVGARARRPPGPPAAPAASSAPPCTLSPLRPTIYLLHLHARDELVETTAIAVVLDLDEIDSFGTSSASGHVACRGTGWAACRASTSVPLSVTQAAWRRRIIHG